MHAAATVLLLREVEAELEVLMMCRGAGLSFMAGMWVFPGGRVDAADATAAACRCLAATSGAADCDHLQTLDGEPVPAGQAVALRVAACRETFEEAGVLLARDTQGRPCRAERVEALQARRTAVAGDAASFVTMLEEEELYLDADRLVYWSHWITPSLEPKRFDTRFFAIAVPPEQAVSADLSELTHHAWIRPARASEAIERGEIRVVPPTLLTLEDLAESYARHGRLDAMLAAERGRAVPAVMPRIDASAGELRVVMPWDPGYASAPGEGCVPVGGFPAHLSARRSCIVLSPGREARRPAEKEKAPD
jgi:8-oxo-dGTP pyrophosphatase MutT (NUDIX family)